MSKDSEYAPGVAKAKRQKFSGLALKVAKRQIDMKTGEMFKRAIASSIKYQGLLGASHDSRVLRGAMPHVEEGILGYWSCDCSLADVSATSSGKHSLLTQGGLHFCQ